jgi:SAM-dependent methyltransferase
MRPGQLLGALRSYYRGCHHRDLQEFYDLESRLPYFDHVSRILGAHKRRILLRWIQERPVQGPILEVGSGIGTFARQLGRHGYRVIAVDISAVKTRKAQRRTAQRSRGTTALVHHCTGDLQALGTGRALEPDLQTGCPWPVPRQFQVLLAADVLEHVPTTPWQTVRHLRRLLTSQGRLFVSVPARLWVNDPGHFWPFLPDEWEEVFVVSGFRIYRRQMSRLCWFGLPTPLPLAMVYELHPLDLHAVPGPKGE